MQKKQKKTAESKPDEMEMIKQMVVSILNRSKIE